MSRKENSPDEPIRAFMDDEMLARERAAFMEALQKDDELASRVREQLHLEETGPRSDREPPRPDRDAQSQGRTKCGTSKPVMAAAAMLIFAIGTLSGWVLHTQSLSIPPGSVQGIAQIDPAGEEYKRVILHVSSGDPERLGQALDDAEVLLSGYRDNPEMVQIEVVANSEGLALLSMDNSPYVERIRRMALVYQNLDFLACSRTLEKMKLKGIEVHLIPEARIIPAALEQIVDRLHEGWVYIRV